MTYVRTRLALDRLASGEVLEVRLSGADPIRQVPASAVRQGHRIVGSRMGGDGTSVVLIEKK